MSKIRVLVVEDSRTVRERLVNAIRAAADLDVIAAVGDGQQAVESCRSLRPDVITMDMMLPGLDGLQATEQIMAHCPTPILVVSSSFNRGELFRTYDALAAGAVDVIEKPRGDEPEGDWEGRLLAAIRIVSRVRAITHVRARLRGPSVGPRPPALSGPRPSARRVIALGASTGGPSALLEVVGGLPPDSAVPVLVVLHLAPAFAGSFAEWFGAHTARAVRYARGGEPLTELGAEVVLAPPDRHLGVRDGRLFLDDGAPRHSCRPSVDVLFETLAIDCGPAVAACLLTGMGRDGASGLLSLRLAGALTLAQDEASSTVYGMPREAALIGAASLVLPLSRIAPTLADWLEVGRRSEP